ncbi:MUT7 Exonuclease, partial [Psilopogon haemacephalus]|nr:MUT7 Exonuclease [Psilopogon haemacephalus]
SLFFQVCNCDKYLKISRERMKQLVESSRQELGDGSGRGKCVGTHSWGCCSAPAPCPGRGELPHHPGTSAEGKQPEGLQQPGASVALPGGTVLQVGSIPPGVLARAELSDFYCCSRCGKVFWEGSHFGRLVSQFQEVLGTAEDQQSLYELS